MCSLDRPQIHHPFVCHLNTGIARYPGQVIFYSFPSPFPRKELWHRRTEDVLRVPPRVRGRSAGSVTCQKTYCESHHVSEDILRVLSRVRRNQRPSFLSTASLQVRRAPWPPRAFKDEVVATTKNVTVLLHFLQLEQDSKAGCLVGFI